MITTYSATVLSNRRITIPLEVFKKLKLKTGQKIILRQTGSAIALEPTPILKVWKLKIISKFKIVEQSEIQLNWKN